MSVTFPRTLRLASHYVRRKPPDFGAMTHARQRWIVLHVTTATIDIRSTALSSFPVRVVLPLSENARHAINQAVV